MTPRITHQITFPTEAAHLRLKALAKLRSAAAGVRVTQGDVIHDLVERRIKLDRVRMPKVDRPPRVG